MRIRKCYLFFQIRYKRNFFDKNDKNRESFKIQFFKGYANIIKFFFLLKLVTASSKQFTDSKSKSCYGIFYSFIYNSFSSSPLLFFSFVLFHNFLSYSFHISFFLSFFFRSLCNVISNIFRTIIITINSDISTQRIIPFISSHITSLTSHHITAYSHHILTSHLSQRPHLTHSLHSQHVVGQLPRGAVDVLASSLADAQTHSADTDGVGTLRRDDRSLICDVLLLVCDVWLLIYRICLFVIIDLWCLFAFL